MKDIILASASPRREALLKQIGLSFSVIPADIDENHFPENEAEALVQQLALSKARSVSAHLQEGLVIGADTVVVQDGVILGKPSGREEAYRMLSSLNGRDHEVMTGLALVDTASGKADVGLEKTRVFFRSLSPEELYDYIDSGECFDKAGGYGIQGLGAVLVKRIEGCYYNVVGLPLTRLTMMLKKWDIKVLGG